ncbi:restriction endonuclease subunit S [Micromonospora sp. D75]|uniref:restriction endonuclease subunit S n=1 Tax=Micromonospora sp. D75 TaxID=2824885 RepID=UPI001B36CFF7|nr:restriction endonuclease subunit S [Micromonospora sp. D75]MBQ1065656.1 restriction endonuclease subunit S [Micromonospora sp. D75]
MKSVRLKAVVRNCVEKSDGTPKPFIGLEDVSPGTGTLLVSGSPLKAAEDSVLHQPGDVLFSKLRPYLAKSYLASVPGTATGEMLVLRPGREVDARFLLYVTLSAPWLDWANTTSYGAKMPRTSWDALGEYRILLPSLEEQRRIANFLDEQLARLDRVIALRQRQIELEVERFEEFRESVVEGDSGRLRPPLLNFIDQARPVNYGVLMPGPRLEEGVPLIEAGDIMRGPISLARLRRADPAIEAEFKRSRLREGDLVMAIRGSVGRVQIVPRGAAVLNVTRDAARISLDSKVALGSYIRHALSTRRAQDWLRIRITGSAVTGVNIADLRKVPIVVPDLTNQRAWAEELDKAEDYLTGLNQLMLRGRSLLVERKRALITAAVVGQIDVTAARGTVV